MSKVAVCLLWTEVHNKSAWITYMIIELNSWAICTHYRKAASLYNFSKVPTLYNKPCRGLQILYAEHKGASVFYWQVRDSKAVDLSFCAHTEVISWLKLESVSHPCARDIGMGHLYLKRSRFPLCGFNVSQSPLDCDFSSYRGIKVGKVMFERLGT